MPTYPIRCTSQYCGRIECEGCRYRPALRAWIAQQEAQDQAPRPYAGDVEDPELRAGQFGDGRMRAHTNNEGF